MFWRKTAQIEKFGVFGGVIFSWGGDNGQLGEVIVSFVCKRKVRRTWRRRKAKISSVDRAKLSSNTVKTKSTLRFRSSTTTPLSKTKASRFDSHLVLLFFVDWSFYLFVIKCGWKSLCPVCAVVFCSRIVKVRKINRWMMRGIYPPSMKKQYVSSS